jgi:diguanylate cyclase (GGDEF)-like protein/PAS domain S-box-containing protein
VTAQPRVLVVEDSEVVRLAARIVLDGAGWEVAEAATAAEGLRAMETVDPDVVLLDLGLPDADGFSVLAELKQTERTAWVPVVVLSGRSDHGEVSRLLLAGAQDYLVKPFLPAELHARLVAARRVAVEHRRLAAEAHALEESERRWRIAFDSAPVPMAEVDLEGRYLKVNGALCELFGHRRENLIGASVRTLCHPDEADEIGVLIRKMVSREVSHIRVERRFVRADGLPVWVAVSVAPVTTDGGRVTHMLTHYLDITDRKRFEHQLEELVDHDPLTGLLNRRGFDAQLERQVAHVAKHGPVGALLVVDLDNFKQVNDTLGHQAGDELIVSVADRLRATVRYNDVVARWGGDEFAVLLPRATAQEAQTVADKIVRAVRAHAAVFFGGGAGHTTASVGVAFFDVPGQRASDVVAHADLSMYQAKQAGRDRTATFKELRSIPATG